MDYKFGVICDDTQKMITADYSDSSVFLNNPEAITYILGLASVNDYYISQTLTELMIDSKSYLRSIDIRNMQDDFTNIIIGPGAIRIVRNYINIISVILPQLGNTVGFDQQSEYHNLDVFEHTLKVLSGVPLGEAGVRDSVLAFAALFHDLGKPDVFSFYDGHGHMKQHQIRSKQMAVEFLGRLGMDPEMLNEICELVLYHDTFPAQNEEAIRKFVDAHSKSFAEKLFVLQRADIMAHSEIGKQRIGILEEIEGVYRKIKTA